MMLTDLHKADGHQTLDMFRDAPEEQHIPDLAARHDALRLGYAGIWPGPKRQMKREVRTKRARHPRWLSASFAAAQIARSK